MTQIKFDHIYVCVKNLDRAIGFYETLLGQKITHREEKIWADFDLGKGCYLGLMGQNIIAKNQILGNSAIPVFSTNNADEIYQKIKAMGLKIIHEIETLNYTDYFYRTFVCEDTEGNLIEIAQYKRN